MDQHSESDSKQELNISMFCDYVNANLNAAYEQWQQAQQSYYNFNTTPPSDQSAPPSLMYPTIDPQTLASIVAQVIVGGGSSSKQRLPRRGNITAVVFPKWLKLSVIGHAHSALTSFGIRLAYGSSLKPQKPCWGFSACLGSLLRLAQGLLMWF